MIVYAISQQLAPGVRAIPTIHLRLGQAASGRGRGTPARPPAGCAVTPRRGNLRGQQLPFCHKTRKHFWVTDCTGLHWQLKGFQHTLVPVSPRAVRMPRSGDVTGASPRSGRSPHGLSPEQRAAQPLTAPRRFPRLRDRGCIPTAATAPPFRHFLVFLLRAAIIPLLLSPPPAPSARHRPARQVPRGRARKAAPSPLPRTAHGRGGRALAGLPLGCRAPWSRPPPLPCWIARPPGPGRSWKFRGGSDRDRLRHAAAPARLHRCPAPPFPAAPLPGTLPAAPLLLPPCPAPPGRLRDAAAVRPRRRRRRRKGRKGPRAPSVAGRRGQRRAGPGHERRPAAAAPAAGHQRGLAAAYPAGEREPLRLPRQEMRGKSRPGARVPGHPQPPHQGAAGRGPGRAGACEDSLAGGWEVEAAEVSSCSTAPSRRREWGGPRRPRCLPGWPAAQGGER